MFNGREVNGKENRMTRMIRKKADGLSERSLFIDVFITTDCSLILFDPLHLGLIFLFIRVCFVLETKGIICSTCIN
jgi:hypothetical protein